MSNLFASIGAVGLGAVLYAVVTFVIGFIAIKIISSVLKKALKKTKIDEALHLFIIRVVSVILWIVVIIAILSALHVNTTSFVTILGACGAAIAFALKDSLGNVAGGLIIIMTKPFLSGEFIEIGDTSGVVDSIDLLATHLHTLDNKSVVIPNGLISTSILTNYSREDLRRVDIVFQVTYSADVEKAKRVLCEVAAADERILKEPACFTGVIEHGINGLGIVCRVWCKTENYFDVDFYMKEKVKEAFDREGITIPVSQMDVNILNK